MLKKLIDGFDNVFGGSKWILLGLAVIFLIFLNAFSPRLLEQVVAVIFLSTPLWLPVALWFGFSHLWVTYVRAKYITTRTTVLLEIRLPREITKSPLAMEAVLNNLHFGPGEGTPYDKYWRGQVRPWWSLEMVSIGGEVHFFVWTTTFFKNAIESAFYAQYPDIEITEVDDYTRPTGGTELDVWGCDIKLSNDDPIPIKTYIDYGLDKDPKEELKVDPLASVLEFLGSVKPGNQVWIQIIFQQTKSDWKKEGEEKIKEIRKESFGDVGAKGADGTPMKMDIMTDLQSDQIKSIGRSINKNGFDVGIRFLYLAEPGTFDPSYLAAGLGTFKQFNSNNLNGFRPTRYMVNFNYPWQNIFNAKKRVKRAILNAYQRRSWFHAPYKTKPFILNTEELATIFHLPGSVVQTPSVPRMPSRREEPPTNLPV